MSNNYQLLFISLVLSSLHPSIVFAEGQGAVPSIAREHSIVLKTSVEQPEWMQLWKRARTQARANDNIHAAELYHQLLTEKPNIEEALREYALILMELEQWEAAGSVLQRLLEEDPSSQEYQLYAGRIALILKRYQRAATYLGQVYSMEPGGPDALEALRGQIVSLQKLDRKEMAYPLMEQLYRVIPHEEESIRRLASYSLLLKQKAKARMYYKTLLSEFRGNALDFLESEPLFDQDVDIDFAVRCWIGYLEYHPYYLPFHEKLSRYYLNSDDKGKALSHLLVLIAHGADQAGIYLQVGKLYLYEEGRPDKALYYYDEYRKRSPKDTSVATEIKRIQAILANDLLVIVENEGAWNLWRDLAKVVPDRLAVYYSMAEKLEKLGKTRELREVLEIIYFHKPSDQTILFQLARLTHAEKDFKASTLALNSLHDDMKTGGEYFLLRADIAEQNKEINNSLAYYKSYLFESPHDHQIILHCIGLAGEIGDMEELEYFYSLAPAESINSNMYYKTSFLYAEILVQNFLYSRAQNFYEELLQRVSNGDLRWIYIHERITEILQYEESYFEAEQKLRLLLLKSGGESKYLQDLVRNGILAGDWNNAWKWHEFQNLDNKKSTQQDVQIEEDLFLEKLSILSGAGQVSVAAELAEDYFEEHPGSVQVEMQLVELFFLDGEYTEALEILSAHSGNTGVNHVLYTLIEERSGKTAKQGSKREVPLSLLLQEALLYEKYGAYKIALERVARYLEIHSASPGARVLHAKILQSSGDDFAALTLFSELSKEYPSEKYFRDRVLTLQFETAKFMTIISELAPAWQADTKTPAILFDQAIDPDILALSKKQQIVLARSFWAVREQDEALRIYTLFLKPPVDQVFSAELELENVILELPPVIRSFWNHVTFTTPPEPDRLTVVMGPEFTRNNMGTAAVTIATGLYADYRWQKAVAEELTVRQDMVDGNYYQAMKDYQKMLNKNPSMESLFDLAGIYSRLGFLGKEAALYKTIKAKSPGYPDLDEAMQRNRLKRKPHAAGFYAALKKKGREGYYDNKQQAAGMQTWFMPSLNHQVLIDYRRIFNESLDGTQELWRNRLQAEATWSPRYDLDFLVLLGGDRGDNKGGQTFLYDFRVNGRLGDMAEGFLSVSQDVVDDTVESLMIGVNSKVYEGGLRLDLLPRLFAGGNYLYTEYSDGNHQNKYELWTSYILHPEPTLLEIRYDYALSHNGDANMGEKTPQDDPFPPGDHPYWSPKEYWQNLFSISFEHQLAENVLGRGAPSYYTLEYSFGYEDGGYDNHQLNAQIYLEISRHFLLNSSFDYIHGSEFEKRDFLLSLIYRW